MPARVPQDVDLEDRLLFGLTAVRFGELALGCLAAVAAWRAIPLAGGPVAALLLALGVVLAWGRWRSRPADHWVVAAGQYLWRTYRLRIDAAAPARWRSLVGGGRPAAPVFRVLDGRPE